MLEPQVPPNVPRVHKYVSGDHGPVAAYYDKQNAPTIKCFCKWKDSGQTWSEVGTKLDAHLEKSLTETKACESNTADGNRENKKSDGQDKQE